MSNVLEEENPFIPPTDVPFNLHDLPSELQLQTLFRCSVKDLIRFKCTSKMMYALIDSKSFIKSHLNFNLARTNCKSLICNCRTSDGNEQIALICFNRPPVNVLTVTRNLHNRLNEPSVPNDSDTVSFSDYSKNMVLAGSINGLVCVSNTREMAGRVIGVWNPAINQWKAIKLPQNRSWRGLSVGFGFDENNSVYKIICLVPVNHCGERNWSRIEIYSLETDSWEEVDKDRVVPFTFPRVQCSFIVKGSPYWVGMDMRVGGFFLLARVNPCSGLYETIEYPKHVRTTSVYPVNVRERVAVLIRTPKSVDMLLWVDMFFLDEVTKNWTITYRIGPLLGGGVLIPQCLGSGHLVMETLISFAETRLFFCDPTRTGCVPGNVLIKAADPMWRGSFSHMQSLVWIKGMTNIRMEHSDEKTKNLISNWSERLSQDFGSVLNL